MNHVIFQSVLTRDMPEEACAKLLQTTIDEVTRLEGSLGRNLVSNENFYVDQGENVCRSHFGKRKLFSMQYHNRVEWRAQIKDSLFSKCNRTLPIARRGTRQLCARAIKNFFSSEPWVRAQPCNKPNGGTSLIDNEVATTAGRFFLWKSGEAKLKGTLTRAVERAFVVGECVVKNRHESRYSLYKTDKTVLKTMDDKFILGTDGNYIVQGKDEFVPKTQPVANEAGEVVADEPVLDGKLYLERDGQTEIPPEGEYQWVDEKSLLIQQSSYNGPVCEIVPTEDFLCDFIEPDIHKAPTIVQLVSVTPYEITMAFGRATLDQIEDKEEQRAALAKYTEMLTSMQTDGINPKVAADSPRAELGEQSNSSYPSYQTASGYTDSNSRSEFIEAYRTFDADGDGVPEEIFLVIDRKRNRLVFADYLSNVTANGKRPFEVITVNRVDGRWHGIGIMEQLEHLQTSIDIWYNRADFSTGSTGTTTFFDASKVMESDLYTNAGLSLEFDSGMTYTPRPGVDVNEILKHVTIPNDKFSEFIEMMHLNMQMASNEASVLGTNDMQAAGLDSTKTATGVRDNASKGDEMFYLVASHLNEGLDAATQQFAELLFTHMDEQEEFEWSEGENRYLEVIRKADVNRLKFYFKLEATGSKNEQIIAAGLQSGPLIQAWTAQSSGMMVASMPLLANQLKAMQIPSVDDTLKAMVAAKQQDEQAMMAAQRPPNAA